MIHTLIAKGHLMKAIEECNQNILENKSPRHRAYYKLLKAKIYERLDEYDETIDIASRVLSENLDPVMNIGSLGMLGYGKWRKGEYSEVEKLLERGVRLFSTVEIADKQEHEIVATFFHVKGLYHHFTGDFDTALQAFQQSLAFREISGIPIEIAYSINNIGEVLQSQGKLGEALDKFMSTLEIIEPFGYATNIAYVYDNIASVYRHLGDFEKALTYNKRAIDLINQSDYKQDLSKFLKNRGHFHYITQNYEKAVTFLDKAYYEAKSLDQTDRLAEIVFLQIMTFLEIDDVSKAEDKLNELQYLNKRVSSKTVQQRFELANAIILKKSSRLQHKALAQQLFEDNLQNFVLPFEMELLTHLHVIDLLLFELRYSEDDTILDEIQRHILELELKSIDLSNVLIKLEINLLQFQIGIIRQDSDLVKEKYNYIRATAEKHDMIFIIEELEKFTFYDERSNHKMIDIFDKIDLEEYISRMQRRLS